VTVFASSAPASSANLGPGFDVVAMALDLRCRVSVEAAGEWSVVSGGLPADAGASRLLRRVAGAGGVPGAWRVEIDSAVPIARGLGSSAALIVAAAASLRAAAGLEAGPDAVFRIAGEVEGHLDNAAAAAFGGTVAVGAGGTVRRLEVHPSLRVLVAVPDRGLLTIEARRVTRGPVETAVAARTAARLVFLIEGLRTADPSLLAEAAGDELHELRRAVLSPLTVRLIDAARRSGALHACWSGAGPAALALATETAPIRSAWQEILSVEGGEVVEPALADEGLRHG
jgi:homoserine kinase